MSYQWSAQQLRAEMQKLKDEALAIVDDKRKSVSQRQGALNRIEPQLKKLREDLDTRLYLDGKASVIAPMGDTTPLGALVGVGGQIIGYSSTSPNYGSTMSTSTLATKSFGVTGAGAQIPSPSLAITGGDLVELHDAALRGRHAHIDCKAVTTDEAPMALVPETVLPPVPYSREPLRVIDLLPAHATSAGSVDFFRVTTPTDAASPVAEGGVKPQSALEFEKVSEPIVKIAHWVEVTDEALSDYPAFGQVVSAELLGGLAHAENATLLNGSVDPAMTGLLDLAGITRARGSDSHIDAVLKCVTDLRVGAQFCEADALVCHPSAFQTIALSKASGSGEYLAGDPLAAPPRTLWGLRVVLTTQIGATVALVASFREAGMALVRMAPSVEVNPWAEAPWKSNRVLMMAEERVGLAIVKPAAICKLTGL